LVEEIEEAGRFVFIQIAQQLTKKCGSGCLALIAAGFAEEAKSSIYWAAVNHSSPAITTVLEGQAVKRDLFCDRKSLKGEGEFRKDNEMHSRHALDRLECIFKEFRNIAAAAAGVPH